MSGIKVVHIYSDQKFAHQTKIFEGDYFSNLIVKVGKTDTQVIHEDHNMVVVSQDKRGLDEILSICNEAKFVVLYNLDVFKMKIALALPKQLKIVWRFYGYELYSMRSDLFYSELSQKYYERKTTLLGINFRYILAPIRDLLKYGVRRKKYLWKAMKRIDYFLALSEEEYLFLQSIWKNLPEFVKLPHFHQITELRNIDYDIKQKTKKPTIILGNNRSFYNNHLDLINIIEKERPKINYDFALLYSYGNSSKDYTNEIKRRTDNKSYFRLIENFMSKEKFFSFYQKASALVINGYRQMAGANIRTAFQTGVKVYLNNKNVHKKWLENEGFHVFSIEDFKNDLYNNDLFFDEENAKHNFENIIKFKNRYGIKDFQKKIIDNTTK
ncbi:hypothetical protein [Fodinibius salsisoli]|uniref:4-alpha-L-fucosyltransferase glycosyl transferase group 56 n=1 Tax=Fodinibius salsisoli TaxID=2820877 RepID=A0ABT3PTE3_9BACT|nr:hypothetical protein [Fodinibius salsisoli]MCW9709130.1 hypothetical protein [Fodinibius salsisoli]